MLKKEKISKFFTPKLIIIYILTLIFSYIKLENINNPLYISLIFALFSVGVPTFIPIVITFIVSIFLQGISGLFYNILVYAFFIISLFIFKPKQESQTLNLKKNVIFTMIIVQILYLLKYKQYSNIANIISYIILIYIFYIIFKTSIDYLYNSYLVQKKVVTKEEIATIVITFSLALMPIIKYSNIINLYAIYMIALISYLSYCFGFRVGLTNAILISLIYYSQVPIELRVIVINMLVAFLFGLYHYVPKKYMVISIFITLITYLYLFQEIFYSWEYLEIILVGILFAFFVNNKFVDIKGLVPKHKLLQEETIKKLNGTVSKSKVNKDLINYKTFKSEVLDLYSFIDNNRIAKNIIENNKILKQIFNLLTHYGKINYNQLMEIINDNNFYIIATIEEQDLVVKPQLNGLISNLNLLFEKSQNKFGYKVDKLLDKEENKEDIYDSENRLKEKINSLQENNGDVKIKDFTMINKKNKLTFNKQVYNDIIIGYVENIENEKEELEIKKILNGISSLLNKDYEQINIEIEKLLNKIIILNKNVSFTILIVKKDNYEYNLFRYNSPPMFVKTPGNVYTISGQKKQKDEEKLINIKNSMFKQKDKVFILNNCVLDSNIEYTNKALFVKYFLKDSNLEIPKICKSLIDTCKSISLNTQEDYILIGFEIP